MQCFYNRLHFHPISNIEPCYCRHPCPLRPPPQLPCLLPHVEMSVYTGKLSCSKVSWLLPDAYQTMDYRLKNAGCSDLLRSIPVLIPLLLAALMRFITMALLTHDNLSLGNNYAPEPWERKDCSLVRLTTWKWDK